jgi:hypothetical protein
MAGKTVEDLKSLRAELLERRRKEAYWAVETGAYNETGLAKLIQADRAIQALDAVIADGKDEPEEAADTAASRAGFI